MTYSVEQDAISGNYYIKGSGTAGHFDYNGGYLYPKSRFKNKDSAQDTCILVNLAYKEGYQQAQKDIRKALGMNHV